MHDILPTKSNIPPHHTLTSLSLTHVLHGSDIYSKIFAHLTLSPLAITCSYVAVMLTTRDLTVILMLAGQLLNECVNFVLKRLVKQARPTGKAIMDTRIRFGEEGETERQEIITVALNGKGREILHMIDLADHSSTHKFTHLSTYHGMMNLIEYLGDGYGMPSSHSQFMAYFATYMIILMYRW